MLSDEIRMSVVVVLHQLKWNMNKEVYFLLIEYVDCGLSIPYLQYALFVRK